MKIMKDTTFEFFMALIIVAIMVILMLPLLVLFIVIVVVLRCLGYAIDQIKMTVAGTRLDPEQKRLLRMVHHLAPYTQPNISHAYMDEDWQGGECHCLACRGQGKTIN